MQEEVGHNWDQLWKWLEYALPHLHELKLIWLWGSVWHWALWTWRYPQDLGCYSALNKTFHLDLNWDKLDKKKKKKEKWGWEVGEMVKKYMENRSFIKWIKIQIVVYSFNPSTQGTEAGESLWVPSQTTATTTHRSKSQPTKTNAENKKWWTSAYPVPGAGRGHSFPQSGKHMSHPSSS